MYEEKKLCGLYGDYDGVDEKGIPVPSGCLGAVPKKYEEGPDLTEICQKAKDGFYLEEAAKNPTPDRYDESGNLIPPGCLGRPLKSRSRSRLSPEIEEKIKSGAYLELARYKLQLVENSKRREVVDAEVIQEES